ncbi:hypothetical protein SLA2020_096420 [Shorea laevis]
MCVSNLYKYVKQNSRPLRSTVGTVDYAIAIVISLIYEKLKEVPDHLLISLDDKNIAAECGVNFDHYPMAMVIDHKSYAISHIDSDHTLIASGDFIQSDAILGKSKIKALVLFKGIGHSINSANNLVLKVLSASPSTFCKPKFQIVKSSTPYWISYFISFCPTARNNAQFMITSLLDMFSNILLRSDVQKAGNPDK